MIPLDLLEESLNREVSLLLKDGRILEGKLAGYDQYMNLVLEKTIEKRKRMGKEEVKEKGDRRLDRVVVRGNNVVSISLS